MAAFDFIVVGGGSAGAVVAARLSEDPKVRVCLLEAGQRPPGEELMPAACAALQCDPTTDWMLSGDAGPGNALGLTNQGRMFQPRGKMLGGSSGINYMAYVRGHPGDFDDWAKRGAAGWSYKDVLPYFKKSMGCVFPKHVEKGKIVLEPEAHNTAGPMGVSVRNPVLPAAYKFLEATQAAGFPLIDYNGATRGGPQGGASLFQSTTKDGKRSSSYRAFLEPVMQTRPNLKVITGALATKVVLEGTRAVGMQYQVVTGESVTVHASREVILAGGAYHSPALLLQSGIGPKAELQAQGVACVVDSPHVGKHLKDHLQVGILYEAPGTGISMQEIGLAMGPDALRAAGVLPADSKKDAELDEESKAVKAEAERQITEWATEGKGLVSSSLYDAVCFYNTGMGDAHTHDAQCAILVSGYSAEIWQSCFNVNMEKYFGSNNAAQEALAADKQYVLLLANPVQPHSEGEVRLGTAVQPDLRMNYLSDPHDMKVFLAVLRRTLEVGANFKGLGSIYVPYVLREKHSYKGDGQLSDALLEDWVRHFAFTVYHPTSTCRIGDVVDAQLRVKGVEGLRVVDASVMPNIISGNTNAPAIMIGEKGAELIAMAHGVELQEFVGAPVSKL